MMAITRERLVFGEWLVRKKRLEPSILQSALNIQNAEKSDTLRSSPRLLGQILLDDFQVFRSRVDLNNALIEFEKVKQVLEARKGELNIKDKLPPLTKSKIGPSGEKVSMGPVKQAADRSLFGQFLIERRKINEAILEQALNTQNQESKETLRQSHRLLGEILLDDFNVFSSRVELNRLLIEFNTFKSMLENQRTELMFLTRDK
jgi:predicted signal transduction protein with EAL and GGDEF domain